MGGIPSKCPKCGRSKAWKEEVNPFTSGVPTPIGRVRVGFGAKGLFAGAIHKALGFHRVTYRCHRCGFRETYELPE